MSRRKMFPGAVLVCVLTAAAVMLLATPGASGKPAGEDKVTICHKPGTPAEKTMQVPPQAVKGHTGHGDTAGPCQPPEPEACEGAQSDECIDGDGIASPQPGAFEVKVGDPLRAFPDDLSTLTGLDLFDRAPVGMLTQDDDLHAEDPNLCPTAQRDGNHDLGQDCKVLDVNGDLVDGEFVTADCEFGGCDAPFLLMFHDVDNDGDWDQGEDLVADRNGNSVFD